MLETRIACQATSANTSETETRVCAYQAKSGAYTPGVVSMVVRWKQRQPWLPHSVIVRNDSACGHGPNLAYPPRFGIQAVC